MTPAHRITDTEQEPNYTNLFSANAQIIDVRTVGEYSSGHIPTSLNIPLDQLPTRMAELDKTRPIITCCAAGLRSETAKDLLLEAGFKEVYNGGSWVSLQRKIETL